MGSFKFRLVTYFVLLALLPVLAASWAFSEVAARGETRSVDSRLGAALRVAVSDYEEDVGEAADGAASLGRSASVQRALADRNRPALVRLARQVPGATFWAGDELLAGKPPTAPAAARAAVVTVRDGSPVGRVVVYVPFDDARISSLGSQAGLESTDSLILVRDGRVIAGAEVGALLEASPGEARFVELSGVEYRAAGAQVLEDDPSMVLYALTPKTQLDDAVFGIRGRLLLFAFGALAFVAALAYLVGRTIVRPLKELSEAARDVARGDFSRRVRVKGHDEFALLGRSFNHMASQLESRLEDLADERSRVKLAVSRFGEALAATHEPGALMPLIVQSVVDATGAVGGRVLQDGVEIARAGEPVGGKPLTVPIGEFEGSQLELVLVPPGRDFADEARDLAFWLGRQAGVALDNARVHRQVSKEAVTDDLTELPNRRQLEDAMAGEIGRVERFGGSLGLIFADLDDFKQVNDRYGHQAGDDVLRAFADVLRSCVREIDLPARYGGEEFAVLLPQTDLEGAMRLAERIRETLATKPVETRFSSPLRVTASFGVAAFPDEPTASDLFAAADQALYRAKRAGKNCVVAADAPTSARRHR
jgi:diguanylate cyclase (GGDEF)-like protein